MPATQPDELPEGYYLENFEYLLRFVRERYDHLLTDEERAFAGGFLSIDKNARKLYVRFSNRKGNYFRLDKLNYPELGDVPQLVASLEAAGLIARIVPPVVKPLEDVLGLCLKRDLMALACCRELPLSVSRAELVEHALASTDCDPLRELNLPVIEVLGQENVAVYQLLFFGNFHQDMTEFVLHELVAPFECYTLRDSACVFRDRSIIDAMVQLQNLSDQSHELISEDEEGDALLDLFAGMPERPSDLLPARRFDRIVNRLARQLERLDRPAEALRLYRHTPLAPSRERQARLLNQLGQPEAALEVCLEITRDPQNEEEKEFAEKFSQRLAKKHQIACPIPAADTQVVKQDLIRVPRTFEKVELCAADWFERNGHRCFYVENTLMTSLFGLAFWDIIFADIPGAFFNPFQRGPADLFTSDFRTNRHDLIQARLRELEDPGVFADRVLGTFHEKQGTANQFVNWWHLDEELLQQSFDCIPVAHLTSVFRRLLSDLKHNSSGFPDLVLFTGDNYELIEIKGPGDRIQKNQARWFRFFHEQGIPARLVNVEYT
jgi:hypothetical protein